MLLTKDILDEKDKRLRKKSVPVTFPMSKEEKKIIDEMVEHLTLSQIEEKAKEFNLRPGMGLAACQIGILKRFFVVVAEQEDGSFKNYILCNPRMISHSEELIYVGTGEGCLSINREVEGIVPRYARVTIEAYDPDGNIFQIRGREEVAVAFQHELDHLDGILFVDKIDPKNPFKNMENMREI